MADAAILAIDQGTTSSRVVAFAANGAPGRIARRDLAQHYPQPGWVEQDPEDIWRDTQACLRDVAGAGGEAVRAIGLTNQRETVVLWDRASGEAIHPAIVWQDRRTAPLCAALKRDGCEGEVRAKTGLVIDPYFSATKLAWLLDHVPGARRRAEDGALAFGTIDSFLLWRLTGGTVHATDPTNAARTLLFDIHRREWDADLCRLFAIPMAVLPAVKGNTAIFGETAPSLLGRAVPISGVAGDQQAALFGQACFAAGDTKATYGTGCFTLAHTGHAPVVSHHGLLTTIAAGIGGEAAYALEGAIFTAGAAVKWLRDGLGLVADAAETARLAASLSDNAGVYLVPAFVGLGAPHWDAAARATICGLTFAAGRAHLARAALEAVAYQTADLFGAMRADGAAPRMIRVDGGMAANDWFCQFLADMLGAAVERPTNIETTAAGAAYLAGLAVGHWGGARDIAALWRPDRVFRPQMAADARVRLQRGWQAALARSRSDLAG